MKLRLPVLILLIAYHSLYSQQPIIDIHLHAYDQLAPNMPASWAGESYAQQISSPKDASAHLDMVMNELKANNIKLALTSSTSIRALENWKAAKPKLFQAGIQTIKGKPILSPDSLRIHFKEGKIDFLGELGLQYYGMKPDDPKLKDHYKVAEENGIPLCLHTGLGPPGGPHSFAPDFRTTLGKPSLLEPVLIKYPKLKVFIAHAGWPYISETIAMLYVYPELYTDIGVLCWALPKEAFYNALKQLIDAGFAKRIMYGTDQMMWPEAISIGIRTVKEAPFLTEEQKRDILYNNAARFLNLPEETIAAHHKN